MMSYNTIFSNHGDLSVPLTAAAHTKASDFAQGQLSREKQLQVYYNTLAVYAVREYLDWLGIETNIETGDSWNQVTQMMGDVADLEVVGLGRLECRAVVGSESICFVPPETWCDRLGYVVVKLDQPYREAKLLGFSPTARNGELTLEALEPLENLIDLVTPQANVAPQKAALSEWLGGIVTQGWEELENFFKDPQLAWRSNNQLSGLESDITWGKVLNLGLQMGNQPMILLITVKPETSSTMIIQVRLQPTENNRYLPTGVTLSLLSTSGEVLQTVESRSYDNFMQMLPFRGEVKEPFRLRVALNQYVLEEDFLI